VTEHEPKDAADTPEQAPDDQPEPEPPPAAENPEPVEPEPVEPEPVEPEPVEEASAEDGPGESPAEEPAAEPEDAEPDDAEEPVVEPDEPDTDPGEPEDEAAKPDQADAEAAAEVSDHPLVGDWPEEPSSEPFEEDASVDEEDEEPRPAGFDKRTDVYYWILVPMSTLVLGPALAATVMFFVALSARNYPSICAAVRLSNGCEETVLRMAAWHAFAFLVGWVLLWAVPWWRGLRTYRLWFAVALALILIAIPLRLIATIHLGTDVY
jgi:hypothetical protein